MNPNGEKRIAWISAVVMVVIIILSALCGCRTQKVVETMVEHVHDTVQVHHSDTVREVKVSHHTDTVKQIETHTFTLNNAGDTIKEIHHYHDLWHTTVIDSTYRYKARMDSLERALEVEKAKNKTITKYKPVIRWWEYVFLLSIVGIAIFFVLKKKKG